MRDKVANLQYLHCSVLTQHSTMVDEKYLFYLLTLKATFDDDYQYHPLHLTAPVENTLYICDTGSQ